MVPSIRPSTFLLVLLVLGTAAAQSPPPFEVQVTAPIASLPFRIVDAEYSDELNAIIAVSESPNQLHVYRPETNETASVNLELPPSSVSVSPDGQFAAVGHDGWIAYVNLATPALVKTMAVTTDTIDVILAGNGWVHALPRIDQWEDVRSIEIATEEETSNGTIRAGSFGRLHPGGTSFYVADNGLSPSDIEKWNISTGPAQYQYDSPYHGTYAMCGDLWISKDGLRIVTACGNVFTAAAEYDDDMRFVLKLSEESQIRWSEHSPAGTSIAVLPKSPTATTDEIRYYTHDSAAYRGKALLPRFQGSGETTWASLGKWLFFDAAATKQYVVVQAEAGSGITNDFGVVTIDCSAVMLATTPTSVNLTGSAAASQFTITGAPMCGWKAISTAPWITTTSTGVSDGTVAFSVTANPAVAPRSGTITVGNATFTVNQAGVAVTGVNATGTSPTNTLVTWTSTPIDHFEIWRASSGSTYTLAGTSTTTAFNDTVSANDGYVYKLRAVESGGAMSAFSTPDYAHTFTLTDSPLNVGTPIRAAHVTDLRTAVNAMRAAAGLSAATFTDPALLGMTAKRVHITELRDTINDLRGALALSPMIFSALPPYSVIQTQTTFELRVGAE